MLLDVADERLDGDNGDNKRADTADAQNQQLLRRERQADLSTLIRLAPRHRRNGKEEAELGGRRAGAAHQNAARIVAPERLVPGTSESTWNRPIISAMRISINSTF